MDKAKEKIPKQCRIGGTCFTSFATIGGNLFTIHLKNINHLHRDSNNLMSVIIILITDVNGGKTVFCDGDKMNDIRKRAHVLKNSHVRFVVGAIDKILHEVSIWTGHRAVLYVILHKSIFLHLVKNGTIFYDKYISSDNKKKYIDDDESVVFTKQRVRKIYHSKY